MSTWKETTSAAAGWCWRMITNPKAVQVQFGNPPRGTRYTYRWMLATKPLVGMRVLVPGYDGITEATIVSLGRSPESAGMKLRYVRGIGNASDS